MGDVADRDGFPQGRRGAGMTGRGSRRSRCCKPNLHSFAPSRLRANPLKARECVARSREDAKESDEVATSSPPVQRVFEGNEDVASPRSCSGCLGSETATAHFKPGLGSGRFVPYSTSPSTDPMKYSSRIETSPSASSAVSRRRFTQWMAAGAGALAFPAIVRGQNLNNRLQLQLLC